MTVPLRSKHLGNAEVKAFLQSYGKDYLRLWVQTKAWDAFRDDHAQEWENYQDSVTDAEPNKRRER